MYKAILYKEWIKIRWWVIGYLVVMLGSLIYIGLDVRQWFEMNDAISVWLYVIQRSVPFFKSIKFVPILAGILLAIIQFVPEMVKKRYRLTFHLPIHENKSLIFMSFVGLGMIALFSILALLGLAIIGSIYFPREVSVASLLTMAPWLLASFVAYLGASAITVDPSWKYRIVYAVLLYPIIQSLFLGGNLGLYRFSLIRYILLSLIFILVMLFPGYRLRKGSRL
ncbi:MAG: hypothetical protein JXR87_07260 [Candidatus Marinimicrobia bacterium]|nr:hypothetical protein [Candidatus Neomarinimicrobiota bacterium]